MSQARPHSGPCGKPLLALALGVVVLVAGCGTTRFEAQPSIPQPLVTKIPVVVGVYMSIEFREKVHTEKREGAKYEVVLGKPQAAGFQRLMEAMFTRAVPVPATDAGARTDPEIRGVLEPVLEDYSFVTPRDSGTRLYAVSIKYRINGYTPEGRQFDTWTFTGYASVPASNLPTSGSEALKQATSLAMRDAAVKLAVEFRDAAIARGLLPPTLDAQTPTEVGTSGPSGAQPAETPEAGSAPPAAPAAGEPAESTPSDAGRSESGAEAGPPTPESSATGEPAPEASAPEASAPEGAAPEGSAQGGSAPEGSTPSEETPTRFEPVPVDPAPAEATKPGP